MKVMIWVYQFQISSKNIERVTSYYIYSTLLLQQYSTRLSDYKTLYAGFCWISDKTDESNLIFNRCSSLNWATCLICFISSNSDFWLNRLWWKIQSTQILTYLSLGKAFDTNSVELHLGEVCNNLDVELKNIPTRVETRFQNPILDQLVCYWPAKGRAQFKEIFLWSGISIIIS